MGEKQACAGRAKLANNVHEPVLNLLPKQNRELLFARCVGQAGDVKQNLPDD
jgi:hypothetical protein